MNIKDMISNNKKVYFTKYQKGELWYKTECGFEFPVSISDTGDGAFQSEDKASFFIRWIRKQIQLVETEKQSKDYQL